MVWEEPMVTNTDKSFESDCFKELQLLQSWFSPSFPIGSYGYSHGLESVSYTHLTLPTILRV